MNKLLSSQKFQFLTFVTANLLLQKSAKKAIKYNLWLFITISLDRERAKKKITYPYYHFFAKLYLLVMTAQRIWDPRGDPHSPFYALSCLES